MKQQIWFTTILVAGAMLSSPGLAESFASGTSAEAYDIRDRLGTCPLEPFIANSPDALTPKEAATIDAELQALCAEWRETVARFLDALARLDAALAVESEK